MKKAIMIPALAFAIVAVMLIGLAETAYGAPENYEQDWVPAMNQPSYWEPWSCTKYNGHGGWIPAQYDAAVIKAGQFVRVYPNLESVGGFQASGPQGKDISWVMKCTKPTPPTTTEPPATTQPPQTTVPPTTEPPVTTIPETTVATTVPPTTAPPTTEPPVEQPTTLPPTSSIDYSDPCIINGVVVPEGEYVIVDFPDNEGTTQWGFLPCSRPPSTEVDPTPELPATGGELQLAGLAVALLAAGAGLTALARRSAPA